MKEDRGFEEKVLQKESKGSSRFDFNRPDLSLPNVQLQRTHVYVLLAAFLVGTGFYFDVHEMILKDDEEIALEVAGENDFISAFIESASVGETTTSGLQAETVENLRNEGQIPTGSSDNVYVVDYINQGDTGVSAFVDIDNREVIDTKYNVKISQDRPDNGSETTTEESPAEEQEETEDQGETEEEEAARVVQEADNMINEGDEGYIDLQEAKSELEQGNYDLAIFLAEIAIDDFNQPEDVETFESSSDTEPVIVAFEGDTLPLGIDPEGEWDDGVEEPLRVERGAILEIENHGDQEQTFTSSGLGVNENLPPRDQAEPGEEFISIELEQTGTFEFYSEVNSGHRGTIEVVN